MSLYRQNPFQKGTKPIVKTDRNEVDSVRLPASPATTKYDTSTPLERKWLGTTVALGDLTVVSDLTASAADAATGSDSEDVGDFDSGDADTGDSGDTGSEDTGSGDSSDGSDESGDTGSGDDSGSEDSGDAGDSGSSGDEDAAE